MINGIMSSEETLGSPVLPRMDWGVAFGSETTLLGSHMQINQHSRIRERCWLDGWTDGGNTEMLKRIDSKVTVQCIIRP